MIVKPSELAPISVLEFAEMALGAGGKIRLLDFTESTHPYRYLPVPPGVLSVLPGYGRTIGREIVSNSSIRKVDITVRLSQ